MDNPDKDITTTGKDEQDFLSMETPEELRPAGVSAVEVGAQLPPALDRPRPPRSPMIHPLLWRGALALLALVLVAVVGFVWYASSSRIVVPDVTGQQIGLARTALIQAGFRVRVSEERFSPRPESEVLSQSPASGTELKKGGTVYLVVSAGTEEFPMPDLVGNGLALARGTLEGRGLVMEVEEVVSTQASGTVLATTPSAGTMVRSGDVVRVSVATPRPVSTGLEPFRMDGVSVLLDPAPVSAGKTDVTLEVTRRLRALLEASGAVVTVLRTGVDSSTADADRGLAASQASATVAVGFSAADTGPAGRRVVSPGMSASLRAKLADRLAKEAPPASGATTTADPVLSSFNGPWVRIMLGSFVQRTDETSFSDPTWADRIARSVYGVLGEVYGRKEGL